MQQCKELEQIKIEYRNIPVPADGAAKLQPVMQRAREKRNARRPVAAYGSLAAAAAVLILLIPGMRSIFLMGSAAGGSDMMYDAAVEESAEISPVTDCVPETESTKTYTTYQANLKDGAAASEVKAEFGVTDSLWDTISIEERNAIEAEILLQMENREEEFYEFSSLSSEQDFYLDEAGCLNVVFPAGSLAAEEYGDIFFTIPKEVFSAQE